MIYYQKLDILHHTHISNLLFEYVSNHTSILKTKDFWTTINNNHIFENIPEFKLVFDLLNLDVKYIAIIYVDEHKDVHDTIHVDPEKTIRVLWPIKNCEGSYTKFYDLNGSKPIYTETPAGVPYFAVDHPENCIEVDSIELIYPILFNPYTPHGIQVNPTCDEYRITATIGFNNPPTF